MKYEDLAKEIVEKVGGRENIRSVVHCITRLRFQLKDEGIAQTEELKEMDGIVTVMKSGGQYQVVIGNHVPEVYAAVIAIGGMQAETPLDINEDDKQKTSIFNSFIDIVSSIFTPTLGVLSAAGMIKGVVALCKAFGWLTPDMGTFIILNAVGDAMFYFFPIILGWSASKKFGGSVLIGMVLGASLVYPTLALSTIKAAGDPLYVLFQGTFIESPIYITFLGIPIILMTYSSSVIPIIIASYVAAKVENFFKKVIPDIVKMMMVPFLTLLIVAPLTFMVIGPIATWAGDLLGVISLWIYNLSPAVAGAFLGGFWQVFVIFGLHWGLVPLAYSNFATLGYEPILTLTFAASFAQIGAVLGMVIKTKQLKLKSLGISAFVTGIFGITEPAIYGLTLPAKTPFIISCVGAAIGGSIMGIAGSVSYIMGGLGIFGIPSRVHPELGLSTGFWGMMIGISVAFVFSLVATIFLYKEKVKKSR